MAKRKVKRKTKKKVKRKTSVKRKKSGWTTIKKGYYKGLRVKKSKTGLITHIRNPKGKRKPVAISQDGRPGFTAHYKTKPYRDVKRGKDAERLGAQVAKKGHKSVEFWD